MGDGERRRSKVSMMAVKSARSVAGSLQKKSMSRMKMRRLSYGFSGVPGIRPVERTSQLGFEFKRPPLLFLNTYQLDPNVKFHAALVKRIIDDFLDEEFTGHKYNAQESPAMAIRLSCDIMRKIKTLLFNRYRVFCVVTVGQRRAQCYSNAIAFLWDHERDDYVDVNREEPTCFIHVTAFGVYLD